MTSEAIKITGLEVFVAGTSWRNLVFVKLTTDAGIVGWGESTLEYREHAVAAHLEFLASRVRGLDALAPAKVWSEAIGRDFFQDDRVGLAAASGIMLACMDIAGKAYRIPVHKLLGGPVRDRISVYANGWYQAERKPETFAVLARSVVEVGHRALKIDPYGSAGELATSKDLEVGSGLVAAIRDAVGEGATIYVDVHGRLTPAAARRVLSDLATHNVGFIEEPVAPSNLAALRELRMISPIPVAGGERCVGRQGFRGILEQNCVDVIQPDICWCGGLLEAKWIGALAETQQVLVALHNAGSPLATMAGCHLGAVLPNFLTLEMFDDFEETWVREALPGLPLVRDGALPVPQSPGIGIEPNEAALAEHPYRPTFMDIYEPGWELRRAVLDG